MIQKVWERGFFKLLLTGNNVNGIMLEATNRAYRRDIGGFVWGIG